MCLESVYSFDLRYYYWKWYKNNEDIDTQNPLTTTKSRFCDFYVKRKYKNIKNEMLNNGIHKITHKQYKLIKKKAAIHQKGDYAKQIRSKPKNET